LNHRLREKMKSLFGGKNSRMRVYLKMGKIIKSIEVL